MGGLFLLLFLVSFICLIIGLVKPAVFSRFIKGEITRRKVALVFGVASFAFFILYNPTSEKITEQKTEIDTQEQPLQKVIAYDIVERWTIPNGGEGKAIVVSPDYLNDADMTALGGKLKNDTENDRNAFIFVFDDKQAALLRSGVTLNKELSAADEKLYNEHYIGQYNKNGNSGFNEFAIYFDGVMGTNQKTIKY